MIVVGATATSVGAVAFVPSCFFLSLICKKTFTIMRMLIKFQKSQQFHKNKQAKNNRDALLKYAEVSHTYLLTLALTHPVV